MNNKIIEGIALKKIYRMGDIDIHALDGVDFEIFEGEFIKRAWMNKSVKKTRSEYYFGVSKGREIIELNPKLEQLGYINFTDEFRNFLKGLDRLFIPLIYLFNNRLVMYRYNRRN